MPHLTCDPHHIYMKTVTTVMCLLAAVWTSVPAAAQTGAEIYQERCAACHDEGSDRIPPRVVLEEMPSARILRALNAGIMMAVALTMDPEDRVAVSSYLGTSEPVVGPSAQAFCADRTVTLPSSPQASWVGWSPSRDGSRFQPADQANLGVDQVRRLTLKWAFGFDGDSSAFAPPTVIDGQMFVGSAGGVVHAMQADSGCLQWTFQAQGPVRSSIVVVPVGEQHALLFGDMTGRFYAVTAETGTLLWSVQVDAHNSARLTAGPVAHDGIVYVPISSWEETRAGDLDYPCCTFRGSVVALRISDGEQLWQTWMTDVPRERGRNARGTMQYGPSGVGVWSTPTLDEDRNLLYIGTGDNYTAPATDTSDAVIALDITTGRIVWSRQLTENDIYNGSCAANPEGCGPDFDFGQAPILNRAPDGRELLLIGQKSGIVWALDPENEGEVVWETRVGVGGINGGVQWGIAAEAQRVFATVSDVGRSRNTDPGDPRRVVLDPTVGGGLSALRIADGVREWYYPAAPCADGRPLGCSPSQPGAVTTIPGVVFTTSVDGYLRAHSTTDGTLLWSFDTMRDFETVNGVAAHGGSIDGPGAVVVGGMVFISSGYLRNGGVTGNVLLAFSAE
jgi:polyvinyl alcohol dehydrogenase (cytochrome)